MSVLVATCALVLTGRALGLTWLEAPIFGIPSGLWVVGMAMLFAQYAHERGRERRGEAEGRLLATRLELSSLSVEGLRSRLPDARRVAAMMELLGVGPDAWEQTRKRLGEIHSRIAPSQTTIRIGVDLCDSDAEALIAAGRSEGNLGVPVEWVRVRAGLIADVERDLSGLDALVRRERRGDMNVFIPETPTRPAAWHDWSQPPALGYPAVFPPRIDPARILLGGCCLDDSGDSRTAARMILACAMMARTGARASAGGTWKLAGRPELPGLLASGGPIDTVMRRLGADVCELAKSRGLSGVNFAKSAARAVSAWMMRSDSAASEEERGECVRAAADLLSTEVEPLFRRAAIEFAAGTNRAAEATLARACMELRRQGRHCESDPLAFIMAEAEVGEPGRVAFGRIAAGIGLLWATSPESSRGYLRDDLIDDLSHAGWLSKRPGDLETLKDLVRALDRTDAKSRMAA